MALVHFVNALRFDPFRQARIVVVFRDEMNLRLAVSPSRRQFSRDLFHPLLVAAAVADEDEVFETIRAEARRNVRQQTFESLLRDADRAGIAHVAGGRINLAFRDEGDDGRDLVNGCDNFGFVTESIRRPRASEQRVGAAVGAGNPWREEYTSFRALYLLQPKAESARRRIYEHNLQQ